VRRSHADSARGAVPNLHRLTRRSSGNRRPEAGRRAPGAPTGTSSSARFRHHPVRAALRSRALGFV